MSSFQARPSILLRKKKDPSSSLSNNQHLELEHEREEAKLAAKRDLRQQREHVRGQQLWGTSADKAELAQKERAEHDAQLAARRRIEDAERQEHARLKQDMVQREADVRRAELAKIEAKREYLAQLRDDNYRVSHNAVAKRSEAVCKSPRCTLARCPHF
jgi:hypothetical protein